LLQPDSPALVKSDNAMDSVLCLLRAVLAVKVASALTGVPVCPLVVTDIRQESAAKTVPK